MGIRTAAAMMRTKMTQTTINTHKGIPQQRRRLRVLPFSWLTSWPCSWEFSWCNVDLLQKIGQDERTSGVAAGFGKEAKISFIEPDLRFGLPIHLLAILKG
jgi:hypothetical protein